MDFKNILSEGLDNMMSDIKNLSNSGDVNSSSSQQPQVPAPAPAKPKFVAYRVLDNTGKTIISAANKQELINQLQSLP